MEGWCLLVNHRVDSLIKRVNETLVDPKGNYYIEYFPVEPLVDKTGLKYTFLRQCMESSSMTIQMNGSGWLFFSNDAVGFLHRWKLRLIMNLRTKSLQKTVDKIKAESLFTEIMVQWI